MGLVVAGRVVVDKRVTLLMVTPAEADREMATLWVAEVRGGSNKPPVYYRTERSYPAGVVTKLRRLRATDYMRKVQDTYFEDVAAKSAARQITKDKPHR